MIYFYAEKQVAPGIRIDYVSISYVIKYLVIKLQK